MRANKVCYWSASSAGISFTSVPDLNSPQPGGNVFWDDVNGHKQSFFAIPAMMFELTRVQIGSNIFPVNNPIENQLFNHTLSIAVFRSTEESTAFDFAEYPVGGSRSDFPPSAIVHRNGGNITTGAIPIKGTMQDLHYDSYHVGRGWIWEPRPEERPRTSATWRTIGIRFNNFPAYEEALHGLPRKYPPVFVLTITCYYHEFE